MMKLSKQRYALAIMVVVLLVGVSLGYAYLTTTMSFTGTAVINNAQWDIHLENPVVTTGSVSTTKPTIDAAKTSASYSITLTNPGDFYEFTIDAKNGGSIDGMIDVLSSTLNGTEITTLPAYLDYSVKYTTGTAPVKNHLLKASKTAKYKVRIEFKKDIVASQLPTSAQTLNLVFSVTYKQADSNGIEITY